MALPAHSPAPPAATSRNGRVPAGIADLCALAADLAALLDRETALIRAMKILEIGPLQADKARLTQLCGTMLKAIDPKVPISKALKEQWQAASKRLGDAAIANEMALRVGHAATDRLVAAIVGHIQQRRRATTSYTPPKPAARGTGRQATLAGITIDRHL